MRPETAGKRRTGSSSAPEPDYTREPGQLALARILLAQDRPWQALALPGRLHAAAAALDRAGGLIETGALRVLALATAGDEAGAVTALTGALMLACPQGHIQVCRRGRADGRAARPAHRGPGGCGHPVRLPGPAPACLRRRAARA
ncbi:MAG TPA: hypothetical protein VMK84_19410 [Streptosporangiaceae bacterium]|nr:hypothetical protein [Streptosporangiaceae bacterium]